MSEECIHGLALSRCASCSPAPAPVASAPAPRAASRGKSTSTRKKASAPRRAAAPKNAPPLYDIGQQRVYHVTHIDNMAGILETHAILADASDRWNERPAIDIAADSIRQVRRSTPVTGHEVPVADYVPFALSPNASFWSNLRAGEPDPRLSSEVGKYSAADFVVLVSTVKGLREGQFADAEEPQVVLADADAANPAARFAATPEVLAMQLGRLRESDDEAALLEAELLVHESVSFDDVALIGVANDRVREVVRRMLDDSGYEHRVAVYPPWYVPTAE